MACGLCNLAITQVNDIQLSTQPGVKRSHQSRCSALVGVLPEIRGLPDQLLILLVQMTREVGPDGARMGGY